jgi:hypothetical protein
MPYDGNMNDTATEAPAPSRRRSDDTYQHPKHDAIVRLLREDLTDTAISDRLHCDRRAVARVRSLLGMAPKTNATTLGDKLDQHSTEPDADGHQLWTGRRSYSGAPVIRHCGKERPAAAVAFERRTGRQPVGTCRASCTDADGNPLYCVAPDHVQDDLERRRDRMTERAMEGLSPQPWTVCPDCGSDWDTHGRVEPDLTVYCRHCNTLRAQRSRAARKEEVTA